MRRSRRLARLAALAALASSASVALAACASPDRPGGVPASPTPTEAAPAPSASPGGLEPSDVVGVRWEPAPPWMDQTITEDGMANRVTPFIELHADGTLEGSDGCNGASGTWTLTAGHLVVELGPSTLMACAGPAVPTLLANASAVTRDGDALVLTLDDGSEGRLVPAAG